MTLEAEFKQLLCEMSLLQYGKTQSFDSSGGRSENPDPRPSGEAFPMADEFALMWGACACSEDERDVLKRARETLKALHYRRFGA